jgi:hypothetical protein
MHYHHFLDPITNIRGDPQKELKEEEGTIKQEWKLCFLQLHQIQHKNL